MLQPICNLFIGLQYNNSFKLAQSPCSYDFVRSNTFVVSNAQKTCPLFLFVCLLISKKKQFPDTFYNFFYFSLVWNHFVFWSCQRVLLSLRLRFLDSIFIIIYYEFIHHLKSMSSIKILYDSIDKEVFRWARLRNQDPYQKFRNHRLIQIAKLKSNQSPRKIVVELPKNAKAGRKKMRKTMTMPRKVTGNQREAVSS